MITFNLIKFAVSLFEGIVSIWDKFTNFLSYSWDCLTFSFNFIGGFFDAFPDTVKLALFGLCFAFVLFSLLKIVRG